MYSTAVIVSPVSRHSLLSLLQKGVAYAGNNVKKPQTPDEPARRFDVSAPPSIGPTVH